VTERIGFLGLGNIGAPIAERLRAAGHPMVVFDVRDDVAKAWAAKGATVAKSAVDVASEVDVVFLSLPTPDVVEKVGNELVKGTKVTHVVDLSTTGPEVSQRVAKVYAAAGKSWVDCPVSGGTAGARAGTLALMVGAPKKDLDRVASMLPAFGKIFHVGNNAGNGQTMKLVNNLLSAGAMAFSAEAVALATKCGLDPETVVTVVNASSGRNGATQDKFPKQILPGTFDAGFAMALMLKDVNLCLRQAEVMGLSMPISELVRQTWKSAVDEVGGDADFTKIAVPVEKRAGVVMRKKKA
jgi:3-hydroxyisobutyrate dehydrogenase-like beta-hydroxyacid dehydrogenase